MHSIFSFFHLKKLKILSAVGFEHPTFRKLSAKQTTWPSAGRKPAALAPTEYQSQNVLNRQMILAEAPHAGNQAGERSTPGWAR
jgi:hypothetical protein